MAQTNTNKQDNPKNELNIELLQILENVAHTKEYAKGQVIYYQGDFASCFYFLKKGKVSVFMTSADGFEKTLNTASQGEFLGEGAFFDQMPRVSSAKAVVKSELIAIDRKKLVELIRIHPDLAIKLLEILAKRIRLLSSQIDSMAFFQADERIAQLLLQYKTEEKGKITVHLTHEEIGNMVNVSRVTVSKILNVFKKKGIIKTNYREIEIADIKKLEAIIGEL